MPQERAARINMQFLKSRVRVIYFRKNGSFNKIRKGGIG